MTTLASDFLACTFTNEKAIADLFQDDIETTIEKWVNIQRPDGLVKCVDLNIKHDIF